MWAMPFISTAMDFSNGWDGEHSPGRLRKS
jgi:hypothetical protein